MGLHLHFDCFSGVSGDMILGALVDAGLSLRDLSSGLRRLPLKGYVLSAKKVKRSAVLATKVDVELQNRIKSPLSLPQIHRMIATSKLPGEVKTKGQAVFNMLAEAEGEAHGVSAKKVHFHEVGVVDSLVDVMGSLLGCHLLGVSRVTASPVNLGSGIVQSSHGTLPVPAPAVAVLAKGLPVYNEGPNFERATPTGFALVKLLAQEFCPLPRLSLRSIGYGAGTTNLPEWPNVLRVFLGEPIPGPHLSSDIVVQVETNVDDLHPQAYESVMERLFGAGALDVTLTPVIMKRGRPGIVLTALTSQGTVESVVRIILRETSALGVRLQEVHRRILPRIFEIVKVLGHQVRMKVADIGSGERKAAPEYRDCKRVADSTGRPVREVMEEALRAYGTKGKLKKKTPFFPRTTNP